jgi:methanogenic corrinoid protein MtbC1
MKTTIEALKKAGLRGNVKIMIGGGQINDIVLKYTSADSFGTDAVAAVRMATAWTAKKK